MISLLSFILLISCLISSFFFSSAFSFSSLGALGSSTFLMIALKSSRDCWMKVSWARA